MIDRISIAFLHAVDWYHDAIMPFFCFVKISLQEHKRWITTQGNFFNCLVIWNKSKKNIFISDKNFYLKMFFSNIALSTICGFSILFQLILPLIICWKVSRPPNTKSYYVTWARSANMVWDLLKAGEWISSIADMGNPFKLSLKGAGKRVFKEFYRLILPPRLGTSLYN